MITVTQSDALDAVHAEKLGEGIFKHLTGLEAPSVVLDLGNAELLSSSALGVLISLNSLVEHAGGKLCLTGASEDFRQILKMTKLEGLVEIRDTVADAMKHVG